MYQKYQTDALVLRSYERGEADRVFALYTREFGFVWARASAVRREASRMRYGLQSCSRANVALVRGKAGWRAVGAIALSSIVPPEAVPVCTRISRLIERFSGEEKNEYLFAALSEAHTALLKEEKSMYSAIELLCVARILYALGYISAEALGSALFTHTSYALPELSEAEKERTKLLSSVNKALSETHL